jgi:RNA polymerase sigma factor (sigma-70 family)
MGEMQNDDLTLLREYARNHSEAAFAALVSHYVNLVYSVALRQVRDTHLAGEITQAVFIILARKADSLGDKIILPGWLCRTARYASANALTIQRRRQHREQEAYMQSQIDSGTGFQPVGEDEVQMWNEISPLLDGAMEKLGQKDHDALVLRFFENKTFAEVGATLGASEDAAKMRVNRALEKLRKFFTKRGVSSTTAIIAGTISANSVQAAPVALAKSVTAVAMAKGAAAAGASTLALVKGTMKTMAWLKMKFALVWGSAIVVAGIATSVLVTNNNSTETGNTPTETQLRQLFDSVARVAPDKMRVVSLHTEEETPPSKEEIQREADATRKMEERIQQGAPEPARTQRIELAVKARLQTMTGKHYEKIQEWKSGLSYRQDRASGWDTTKTYSTPATDSTFRQYMTDSRESLEVASLKTNYEVTEINLVNPTNGAASMREIMYGIKSFRIRDGGALYTEADAWKGIGAEDQVAIAVAAALASNDSIRRKARDERQKMLLDEEKLKRILSGQDSSFKISVVETNTDGQPRLVFEFKPLLKSRIFGAAGVLIECVKTNFNRITRTEVKNSTGKIQFSSTRAEFDERDFPHEYRVIENGDQGYTTNQFSIQEADLDAHFSDNEVFRLESRKDFGVVVDTGGKPVIKSYPDGITPKRIVDVSDIVADLNAKKPAHGHRLFFAAVIAFVSILSFAAWQYFRKAKS